MWQGLQGSVQAVLDEAVARGDERGVQFAAYHRGKPIVHAWAGLADGKRGTRVDGRTLFPVFSTSKGFGAMLFHQAAQRGTLRYDAKMAEYWPGFAQRGKEDITLRQVLCHAACIPQAPGGLTRSMMADEDIMRALMEETRPLWRPGTHWAYHAVTYGWLLGELLRRVDGRGLPVMIYEDICRPLGMEDLYVGLPEELEDRVAVLEEPEADTEGLNGPDYDAIPGCMIPLHEWMNGPEGRRASLLASSGIMSAGAMARAYAALLPGGVEGVRLLSDGQLAQACEVLPPEAGGNGSQAMGFQISGERMGCLGHGGYGGSQAMADRRLTTAYGFTRNLFSPAGEGLFERLKGLVEEAVTG